MVGHHFVAKNSRVWHPNTQMSEWGGFDKITVICKRHVSLMPKFTMVDFFDTWALNGKHLSMEKGHSKTVNKFLKSIDFADSFSFLDVGCGNGWVVRAMAENTKCSRALGIDVSAGMIKTAKSKSTSKKEAYLHTGIESYKGCMFDYVFSMESLYYVKSISDAVRAIWHVLKPGGMFFCGTDYYAENSGTLNWQKSMQIPMHLLSIPQWEQVLCDVGFTVLIIGCICIVDDRI